MEKAILKTLIYSDIFDYPLNAYEIHRWLIAKKADLIQIQRALRKLITTKRIARKNGYYFLKNKENLVGKRLNRKKQSVKYFTRAKVISQTLKIIPWIKLVGISGGLAMENVSKIDDIDLFIITSKNRLWICRLLILLILSALNFRRKASDSKRGASGKVCVNLLLDEGHLKQSNEDLYTAHEVLQMRVLWQKDGVYSKYLAENEWVFKFLPNWITILSSPRMRGSNKQQMLVFNWIPAFAGMTMESLAKRFQLKIMQKPLGMERVQDGALYFHPLDYRGQVMKTYLKKTKWALTSG